MLDELETGKSEPFIYDLDIKMNDDRVRECPLCRERLIALGNGKYKHLAVNSQCANKGCILGDSETLLIR